MNPQYSIAQTRHNLAEIVHEAESGQPVAITRRGKPVAVLLSQAEFERLSGRQVRDVWEAIAEFRASHDLQEINEQDFAGLREQSTGREFSWES